MVWVGWDGDQNHGGRVGRQAMEVFFRLLGVLFGGYCFIMSFNAKIMSNSVHSVKIMSFSAELVSFIVFDYYFSVL